MKILLPVPHVLGGHCASSAFRDLVLTIARRHGAALPSEALLFALSGGLDFLYWRRPGAEPPIYLLGRTGALEAQLAARLGIGFQEVRPASAEAAWAWLRATLAAGQPALVLADVGELPYLNARTHFTGHRLLVIGIDDAGGHAVCAGQRPRRRAGDHPGGLRRVLALHRLPRPDRATATTRCAGPPPCRFWRAYPRGAVAETVRLLDGRRHPVCRCVALRWRGRQGLAGLDLFVADLPRWPDHFAPAEVTQALRAVYLYVEKAGTGFGGFFRAIYGTGLREAAHAGLRAGPGRRLGRGGRALPGAGPGLERLCRRLPGGSAAAGSDPADTLAPLLPLAGDLQAAEQAGRDLLASVAAT